MAAGLSSALGELAWLAYLHPRQFAEFPRPGRKASVEPPWGLSARDADGSDPTSAIAGAMKGLTLGTLVLIVNCQSGMK